MTRKEDFAYVAQQLRELADQIEAGRWRSVCVDLRVDYDELYARPRFPRGETWTIALYVPAPVIKPPAHNLKHEAVDAYCYTCGRELSESDWRLYKAVYE